MNNQKKFIPRGIRNNNPLNIRIGNNWLGEVENPTDKDFEQFVSMFYGLRAGFILLKRYIERYHLQTIVEIVSRWSPPMENHTARYIDTVVQRSGIAIDHKLSFYEEDNLIKLVEAMCWVECGKVIPINKIEFAYYTVAYKKNL